MGLRLEIKKLLGVRSERVKSVEFHPSEPWILASLYSGQVVIWHYETQATVKTFEICDAPVRTSKWIIRKNWFIAGSDDMIIRVFNYNTHEKVTSLEGHTDYIRCLAVHPTRPFVLSSSDDMSIKLWDWEQGWKNTMVFDGHSHYVMMVVFNPKDPNTFASASLDRSIKIWNLGSSTPNFTLSGHEKGVNCVEYYRGGDKPYIISGADDRLVKIWDYQNKSCVQTLSAHTNNISAVCFHPELPIIVSAAEDGTVRIWHSNTYRLENTLNYGYERAWSLCYTKGSNHLGFGYDEGAVVIKLGREEPSVSMDQSGKIIWARHNEILTANVKTSLDQSIKEGEKIALPVKELGNSEIYPQSLVHSPNGRFVVVCGDGEYIIYTALAWRNKSYGSGLEFVWAADSNEYAVRESTSRVKVFKNFKEKDVVKLPFSTDGIFGGTLLGIRSSSFLCFYDWETANLIRRIDVNAKAVYWSDNNEYLAIVTEDSFYTLRYISSAYSHYVESGVPVPEDGVEDAFEFLHEVNENVTSGTWAGACFIYTSNANRLNYLIGTEVTLISHSDHPLYLLGYVAKDSRVYLVDKDVSLVSFSLSLSVIDYQTAILSHDLKTAESLLPSIPEDQKNRVARFLESQGFKEEALNFSSDNEHKFELALQLKKYDIAFELAALQEDSSEHKWRVLSDLALHDWKFDFAEKCMWKGNDFYGLMLLYQATGNPKGLLQVSAAAQEHGKHNLVFMCLLLTNQLEACIEMLVESKRIPEAVLFARTYCPRKLPDLVSKWKQSVSKSNKRVSDAILSPDDHPEHFPDFSKSIEAEKWIEGLKIGNLSSLNLPVIKNLLNNMEIDLTQCAKSGQFPSINLTNNVSFEERTQVKSYAKSADESSVISDSISMEVNTTGTGSVLADEEMTIDQVGNGIEEAVPEVDEEDLGLDENLENLNLDNDEELNALLNQ